MRKPGPFHTPRLRESASKAESADSGSDPGHHLGAAAERTAGRPRYRPIEETLLMRSLESGWNRGAP